MEFFFGLLTGILVMILSRNNTFKIVIKQEIDQAPVIKIPDMVDTLKDGSKPEDELYANMGDVLDDINKFMTGGGTNE